MQLHEIDVPLPKENDVLIAVNAAGVNPIDFRLRSGEWKYLLQGGLLRFNGNEPSGIGDSLMTKLRANPLVPSQTT